MSEERWVLCPACGNKTRTKVRGDTVLENFPLFCPKCRRETVITLKNQILSIIKEPDAQDAEPMNL
mgnify:CR=1 FL=1